MAKVTKGILVSLDAVRVTATMRIAVAQRNLVHGDEAPQRTVRIEVGLSIGCGVRGRVVLKASFVSTHAQRRGLQWLRFYRKRNHSTAVARHIPNTACQNAIIAQQLFAESHRILPLYAYVRAPVSRSNLPYRGHSSQIDAVNHCAELLPSSSRSTAASKTLFLRLGIKSRSNTYCSRPSTRNGAGIAVAIP